jgi:hypothetical protein
VTGWQCFVPAMTQRWQLSCIEKRSCVHHPLRDEEPTWQHYHWPIRQPVPLRTTTGRSCPRCRLRDWGNCRQQYTRRWVCPTQANLHAPCHGHWCASWYLARLLIFVSCLWPAALRGAGASLTDELEVRTAMSSNSPRLGQSARRPCRWRLRGSCHRSNLSD